MFLKKHVRKKNGKAHTYWDLVESYRTPRGPRHRTVAYLGELDVADCGGWAKLARQLDYKPLPVIEPTLFDPQPDDEPVPEEATVNGVRVDETTDFGDVWLGLTLWRTLGLDKLFARILPEGREDIGWDLMAAILVLGRFCQPSGELHIEDTWYPRTMFPEILGVKARQVHVRRLYQALDVLCGCKDAVEKHLKNRLGELFNVDYDLMQRNSRAAGKYDIQVIDDPDRTGHFKLIWRCREEWADQTFHLLRLHSPNGGSIGGQVFNLG